MSQATKRPKRPGSSSARRCAYCRSEHLELTREHIFTAALQQLHPQRDTFSAAASGTFVGANSAVTRDVCAHCNNVTLSAIDDVVAHQFKKHATFHARDSERGLLLELDARVLARWVLKTSYNSARASKSPDIAALESTRSFILGRHPWPRGLSLYGGIVRSVMMDQEQRKITGREWIDHDVHRISVLEGKWDRTGVSIARAVFVDAIVIVIVKKKHGGKCRELTNCLESDMGMRKIHATSSSIELFPAKLDAVGAYLPHVNANLAAYEKKYGKRPRHA